jgi:3-deoxy-D-manno-octulosonic-acid transferase
MGFFERSGWWLYEAAMAGGLLCAAPWLLVRRGAHYTETLPGRLGLGGGAELSGALWIHAVSVGEVAVAATLVRALPEDLPLVITTVTPTGQAQARTRFLSGKGMPGEHEPETAPRRAVAYLPFDLGFSVRRFFRRFSPRALVLVEGDYWPLVLREARRRGLPVAVVNGRVGETSARRLARAPRLAANLFFSTIDRFGVQTEQDRQRLVAGGAEPSRIHITGNLKYDTHKPAPKPELEDAIRRLAHGRPILVAGSTMAGEDEAVLAAFRRLGGGERALLLLVPRHPERWDGVARLVQGQGFRLARRSALGEIAPEPSVEVLLLDSLGELAALYALAAAAFIGGTLVPTGGHNPLEPACFAVPTVVGPSMFNFRDMAERFDHSQAWSRAADAEELAQVWDGWLHTPEQARAVGRRAAELLEANRGALGRTVEMLEPLLAAVEGRP